MAKVLANKDVPWCLIFLVAAATTCNVLVLTGNLGTAKSFQKIGGSTKGWSNIGLQLSHSFQHELDVVMTNMSAGLINSINDTLSTNKYFNMVVSLAGQVADGVEGHDANKAVSLLQEHMIVAQGPPGLLPGMLNKAVDKMVGKILDKAIELLNFLFEKLKPVLTNVGEFLIKFGDKIQAFLETFSITLDKVQKLFDQVMASFSSAGAGAKDMEKETFNLFDMSNSGEITLQDLTNVATTYSISAFAGSKSANLMNKYDTSKNGGLDKQEFSKLVKDPSLPGVMAVLLRQYSKILVETAGNVAAGKQRDEIAARVVNYLQLVVAKNKTKMSWVSQALSNNSLPLDFTADVMASLALSEDDPNTLTTESVGKVVVGEMMKQNPSNTAAAYKRLQDPKRWVAEGYHESDHPKTIERVTAWMAKSGSKNHALFAIFGELNESALLASTGAGGKAPAMLLDTNMLDAMPKMAFESGVKNMKAYVASRSAMLTSKHAQMFATKSSRLMLAHLLGNTMPTDEESNEATRVVKSGQPAKPETLQFAQWLAANASATSKRFQKMCFDYTGQSSSAADGFATQIQGMVKKIGGFIEMMMKYSTPAGIDLLEAQVKQFELKAAADVQKLVQQKVGTFINASAPELQKAMDGAIDKIGGDLGHKVAEAISTPMEEALAPALSNVMAKMLNESGDESSQMGQDLSKILGADIGKMSGDMLGNKIAEMIHDMINKGLTTANEKLNLANAGQSHGPVLLQTHAGEHVSLAEVHSMLNDHAALHLQQHYSRAGSRLERLDQKVDEALHDTQEMVGKITRMKFEQQIGGGPSYSSLLQEEGDLEDATMLSGAWTDIAAKLRSFSNILPQATKTLKFAREEVSKLASHLDSLFKPFEVTGPKIFDDFSGIYSKIWTMYFCVVLPINMLLLYYGFWAGGFFGGPGSVPFTEDGPAAEEPEDLTAFQKVSWKCGVCCNACLHCCKNTLFSPVGFWSFVISAQVVVLLFFVVALILLIMSGVDFFVSSGCSQIYILSDPAICGSTLQKIRNFLGTFLPTLAMKDLPQTCHDLQLLTCETIGSQLKTASMMTAVFGFLAAILSFQLLVESSILHTRAVCRRAAVKAD